MISIIICSKQSTISNELQQNISKTIGNIPFEFIIINNSENKYSIFQAYNKGVKEAIYPYLVFMHEDILYHTLNWGCLIINKLNNLEIGLLGVVGAHYIDQYSEYYHTPGISRGHIIQSQLNNKTIYKNYEYKDLGSNVVVIDGVWIATRKELFDKNLLYWDENTYNGFHCYDMDISMQAITQNLKVQIVDELLIEHKSMGNFNSLFYESSKIFHKKWNKHLPIMFPDIPYSILNIIWLKEIEKRKKLYQELQWYKNTFNRIPYKIITKLLLMLHIKLYD